MAGIKYFLREHRLAVLTALFIVGAISILPQIIFIAVLGHEYRGIYFFQTPNEEAYLAIIREVAEGHLKAASVPFFEYKNAWPLLPPTVPIIYAVFGKLLSISLINTIIISKFFLPALLFFLVYFLIYKLTGALNATYRKISAIAGGLLVSLGLELSDYRSIFKYLAGQLLPADFLIWTRPVNPIAGAIFIFAFLLCLWEIFNTKKRIYIFPAALFLALMMASYFFSWSLSLAVSGVLGLIAIFKKQWGTVVYFVVTFFLAIIFSLPYWYMVWRASQALWYTEATARIGLLSSRAPHLNKFLIVAALIFLAVSFSGFYRRQKQEKIPLWWWFCFSFLASGFIVYNQQVLTGREIWLYHYIFYTVPFGYAALVIVFWYFLRPKFPRLWLGFITSIIIISISSALYIQFAVYKRFFADYKEKQRYVDVFDFFNTRTEKDCVVLVNEKDEAIWHNLIPAFTHCNTYFSGERTSVIAPPTRFYHNYFVLLRIRGVSADEIDKYLKDNRKEAAGYLYYQLQYSLGYKDQELENLLQKLPLDYKEFVKNDFYSELKKYRLDYLFSSGPIDKKVQKSLPSLKKLYEKNNFIIYSL